MRRRLMMLNGAAVAVATGLVLVSPTEPQANNKILKSAGTLTCLTEGGVVNPRDDEKDMSCTFKPTSVDGQAAYFRGEVGQAAAETLGRTKTLIVWQVLSRGSELSLLDMEGSYKSAVGHAVPAAPGSLVQKTERNVILQPLTHDAGATGNRA